MLKSVLNRDIFLACLADCPTNNHARPLALFLYGTLCVMQKKYVFKLKLFPNKETIIFVKITVLNEQEI